MFKLVNESIRLATNPLIEACLLLSKSERRVLKTFNEYLMTPGKMLCFSGVDLEKYSADLSRMTNKKLLVKEKFKGAYSLTRVGFAAMKDCSEVDCS